MFVKLWDILRSERPMSEKVGYVWEYYRRLFLIVVVLLLGSGAFLSSRMSQKETVLTVVVYQKTAFHEEESFSELTSELTRQFVKKANQQISFNYFAEENYLEQQKFVTMIAAQEVQLLIVEEKTFTQLAAAGQLADLSTTVQALENDLNFSGTAVYGIDMQLFPDIAADLPATSKWFLCQAANNWQPQVLTHFLTAYGH